MCTQIGRLSSRGAARWCVRFTTSHGQHRPHGSGPCAVPLTRGPVGPTGPRASSAIRASRSGQRDGPCCPWQMDTLPAAEAAARPRIGLARGVSEHCAAVVASYLPVRRVVDRVPRGVWRPRGSVGLATRRWSRRGERVT